MLVLRKFGLKIKPTKFQWGIKILEYKVIQ